VASITLAPRGRIVPNDDDDENIQGAYSPGLHVKLRRPVERHDADVERTTKKTKTSEDNLCARQCCGGNTTLVVPHELGPRRWRALPMGSWFVQSRG